MIQRFGTLGLLTVLAFLFTHLDPVHAFGDAGEGAPKSDLKVLYVGPDADVDPSVPSYLTGDAAERFAGLTRERPGAFRSFLEEHFQSVEVVTGRDYDASMSEAVDVTVFDVLPKIIGNDRSERRRRLRLPEGFSLPAVTVGEVGPMMLGRFGFGLKIDHL